MLYLANRKTNILEVVATKNLPTEDEKYFNATTFQKDEKHIAEKWLSGEDVVSRYEKRLENISTNPVKVFFDLEFIIDPYRIWSIGFIVTVNDEIVEKFFSFVNPEMEMNYLDREKMQVNQADLDNAPTIQEILPKIDAILAKYPNADCFSWGRMDAGLIAVYDGVAAEMLSKSTDLQKVIRKKFEVADISLENALKYSDYFFVHTFNPLEDSIALSFVYTFAESCNESFLEGLNKYAVYKSHRNILGRYEALRKNQEMYESYIEKMRKKEKCSKKEQKKITEYSGKLQKMKALKAKVDVEGFMEAITNTMFVIPKR